MSLCVNALQDEVMLFLWAREQLCEASLSPALLTHLLAALDTVWRQAVHENEVNSSDDHQFITLAADAILALANAGVKPEDIKRYALAHVLFMTKPSNGQLH